MVKAMAWVLLVAGILFMVGSCGHPWFKSRFPWEPKPDGHPEICSEDGTCVEAPQKN